MAERSLRGRLPDGKLCKSGTCPLDHDIKYPGKPCFNDPRVAISIPHEAAKRAGYLDRLKDRRAVEGKRLNVTPKPVTVSPPVIKVIKPVAPLTSAQFGTGQGDGIDDDWGAGGATLADIAPAHPLMPGAL